MTPYTEMEPVVVGAGSVQEQQSKPPMTPDLGWPVGEQEQRPGDGKAKPRDKETLQRMLHPEQYRPWQQEPAQAVEAQLQARHHLSKPKP